MGTPDNVFQDASTYIRTYFLGVIFVIMYNTSDALTQQGLLKRQILISLKLHMPRASAQFAHLTAHL